MSMASFQFTILQHCHLFYLWLVICQTSKTVQINFVENHNVLQFLANVQNISPEDTLKIVITRQAKQDRRNTQLYVPLLATLLTHILG